uniref:Uncharacterized protein n=1 Tax=Desertifilum tharense IPPAS B-1220 TaxID=1781255 RepID=A0ACD5GXQ4_9CYAN
MTRDRRGSPVVLKRSQLPEDGDRAHPSLYRSEPEPLLESLQSVAHKITRSAIALALIASPYQPEPPFGGKLASEFAVFEVYVYLFEFASTLASPRSPV